MIFYVVAIASLLIDAIVGVYNKHLVLKHDGDAPLKMFVWFSIWCCVINIVLYAAGLSETGLPPWMILAGTPAILYSSLCTVLYLVCYCFCLRFIKLTIAETIIAIEPACIMIGLIWIYLHMGKMTGVKELLNIRNGIPLIIMLISAFILTLVSKNKSNAETKKVEKASADIHHDKYLLLGVLLAIDCTIFDSGDSLISVFTLTESEIGSYDFMIGYAFVGIIAGIIIYAYLYIKNKSFYNPFCKTEIPKSICATGEFVVDLLYVAAADMNAVKYEVMWAAYPILPIIMSRLLLKEKCTWKQYICIAIVLAMSFLLSINQG